jgi:O-antigen/teichoic acid export membrane protein
MPADTTETVTLERSQAADEHPPPAERSNAKGVSVLTILVLLGSGLNYLSSVIFSRVLDPVGFGELTSLLALAAIVAVPTVAGQTLVAERVAVHASQGRLDRVRYMVRHGSAHILVIATAGTVAYLLCIPIIAEVMSLEVVTPAVALSAVIFFGFVVPFALGVLQGLNRLVLFGLLVATMSLSRIVFGVGWVLVANESGAGGAIAGQALGMAGALALAAWMLRDMGLRRGSGAAKSGLRRRPGRQAMTASLAFVAFAVISSLDLLLAKVYLEPREVGVYAAVSAIGKVVTFLPATIAVAMVPNAARANLDGRSHVVLRHSGLLVFATAMIAAVPLLLAPDFVVGMMFGPGYEEAADAVLPIVIAGAALAMINLLVVYVVAIRDQRWGVLLLIALVIQVVGIASFHDSVREIATVQAIAAVAVLVANEVGWHSMFRRRRVRA